MRVFYYDNSVRKQQLNEAGLDYTPAYIPEMLSLLGINAEPVDTQGLLGGGIGAQDVLLTGNEALPEGFRSCCTHIAFQTAGDLSPFGVEQDGVIPKMGNKYDIDGYCLCEVGGRDFPLPVLSSFAVLRPLTAETLAFAQLGEKRMPAILACQNRYYFAFDLPATVWYAGDGRPVRGGKNGFPLGRVPDTRPVPLSYDTRIAYTDVYMVFLQQILCRHGVPMVHRLPPMEDGSAPDFLLCFAGDDDAGSWEMNRRAAAVMAERGLPYHLNVMPAGRDGCFVIDREQQENLRRCGCEVALHPDFTVVSQFGEEGYRIQAEMFERAFGRRTVTTVNHCLVQQGSCAERLRYQEKLGILADNNKMGEVDESDINAFNLWGFAFGTAFPRYTLDDAAHDNARIGVAEIPHTYYEPRLYSRSPEELDKLHTYIDQCAFWARTGELFFHPHYLSDILVPAAPALAALDECLSYIREKAYKVYMTAPDALAVWWRGRAASRITEVTPDGFVLDSQADALSLRLPEGVRSAFVDGIMTDTERKVLEGGVYTLLTVRGLGKHRIVYVR